MALSRRLTELVRSWPLVRQATGADPLGRGVAAESDGPDSWRTVPPRTDEADAVTRSVCPFCAVGCGQRIYSKQGRVTQIEGDPDSPVSRGRLCARGSSSLSLVTSPTRLNRVRYRRPGGTEWEDLDLSTAMDMIADRVVETRARTWHDHDDEGRVLRRTLGLAHLGGATLDNEENYLLKKLYTAIGAVQVENQARI